MIKGKRRIQVTLALVIVASATLAGALLSVARGQAPMKEVRLMTLEPGHFHAALIQKEMYPGVSSRVNVYAPLGFDLTEHLNRIARFNQRPESPTKWELEVHTGASSLARSFLNTNASSSSSS